MRAVLFSAARTTSGATRCTAGAAASASSAALAVFGATLATFLAAIGLRSRGAAGGAGHATRQVEGTAIRGLLSRDEGAAHHQAEAKNRAEENFCKHVSDSE